MNPFVIDASVVMAWCFEDEADQYADSILTLLADSEAMVPSIWPLEVANVLLVAERRKRLTVSDSVRFLDLLDGLPIIVDYDSSARALKEVLFLAREQNLSSYDASYLELAMREGVGIATRDERLRIACEKCGVMVVG